MLLPNERMTIKERKHDYLYDPLYSLSSAADHERIASKDHSGISKMQKLFSFQNLFSEIPIYRPYVWRLNPSDPVSMFVSRYFHHVDVCKKLIQIQLRKDKGPMIGHVFEGMNRSKYFTHHTLSLCPYPSGDPKSLDITLDSLVESQNITNIDLRPKPPVYVSRCVQTIYRDSEAQTDPYSPSYVVNIGENLQTLKLTSLSYGYGLPVGLFDVERIERARKREEVEATLQPYKDITNNVVQIAKRRKILEVLENREWYFREREVEAMLEVRLTVIVQLLRRREQRKQEVISRRLDQKWSECCAQNETKYRVLKYRYIGEIRKLLKLRLAAKESKFKRDIIIDYAKPSSQVFAPLTRLGVFPDRSSERYVVKNIYSSRFEGLLTLEASLPRFVFRPRIGLQQPIVHTKDGFLKRKYRHQKELAELHDYLQKNPVSEANTALRKPRFLQKIEKPMSRPITPDYITIKSEESEKHEVAVIMLQQLIRGRAIQTEMYEGKGKYSELIAESRSTHALLEDEQAQKKREKLKILTKQEDFSHLLHQERLMENILGQFECASLANMLDFLSKELDRLIEERRIHALVLIAERQRRIREAEESGTRQKEERRRREQDEIFKQLVKVHEETVDSYLKNIADLAVNSAADYLAKEEISTLAQKIEHDNLYELNRGELKTNELAAELIHNFLIPFVNKRSYELQMERRKRKYLDGAHSEIWGPSHDAAGNVSDSTDLQLKHQDTTTLTPNGWW
ncbi:unnamed protein product [Schistosoma rodhaini]|uniref:Cilia- and flagella-associated protein 91 n=1 Tax=Schistosoma rodhaini TaxID=6188 RepID=A0AA85GAR6_9TREM|nr:unnamed protein product [Schistosoma rodhaini]